MLVRFDRSEATAVELIGWPVHGIITARFGATAIPAHAAGHTGVDIAAAVGTPVYAPASGVVKNVFSLHIEGEPWAQQWKSVFGNSVILDHGGAVTLYAHLATPPLVYEGEHVEAGRLLGSAGMTGTATGPHLHWGMAPASNPYLRRDGPGGLLDPLTCCTMGTPEAAPTPPDLASIRTRLHAMRTLLEETEALLA